jgi:hypothetical protein
MDDISNRTLAIFLITAIIVSLGATVTVLNKINLGSPTGMATSDTANVSLTVSSTVSFLLRNDTIDFGSGYVNDSQANYCGTNATLIAGTTYYDTLITGVQRDCWTGTPRPTALHIENDGNNNITLKVLGPTNATFFNGYSGGLIFGIDFNASNYETGACASGLQGTWLNFNAVNQTICDDMLYAPATDEIALAVRVIIPRNLAAGTYRNQTIQITAEQS